MTTRTDKTPQESSISLKAKDIVTLIKVAKTSGLTHFRYGNLEFSLKTEEKPSQSDSFLKEMPTFGPKEGDDAGAGALPLKIPEEDMLHDLMLADPVAYEAEIEKRLAAGDDE